MSRFGEPGAPYPTLAAVFLSMLVIMFLYELAKQLLSPNITIWESHAVTIVFTSIITIVLVFFPLQASHREQQKAQDELQLRQAAEERLRKFEAEYRAFVESIADSIYTVDCDCRYLLINTRHLSRQGLSSDAYTGRKYGDFHTPDETCLFEEQVKKVIRLQSQVQDEYERNGRYFLRKLNPVIDPLTNEVIAITVISSDITMRRLAEKNLETINLKLNLINEVTRHDILNQLTALHTLLSLAGEQSDESETKKYLARSGQIIDTIRSQIYFARDYQKIGVESPQWQDIVSVIRRSQGPLKLTSVTIDESCNNWEIYADPLLEKVFFNLIDNAIRYAGPDADIRFSVSEDRDRLLLVCEDNGPGVSGENKEKIFQRGFGRNTGLGLFLIRAILSITGITIRENGVPGQGSRFEIAVPSGAYHSAVRKQQI
jgi:PAS domain S-box-containing protein